jgi:hypothetical protein
MRSNLRFNYYTVKGGRSRKKAGGGTKSPTVSHALSRADTHTARADTHTARGPVSGVLCVAAPRENPERCARRPHGSYMIQQRTQTDTVNGESYPVMLKGSPGIISGGVH